MLNTCLLFFFLNEVSMQKMFGYVKIIILSCRKFKLKHEDYDLFTDVITVLMLTSHTKACLQIDCFPKN